MSKKKIIIITIVSIAVVMIALLLAYFINLFVFWQTRDLNLLELKGTTTKKLLEPESVALTLPKQEVFRYSSVKTREEFKCGIQSFGVKVSFEYDDGTNAFDFDVYEVKKTKTKIYDYSNILVGANGDLGPNEMFIVISNGDVDMLKMVIEDMGMRIYWFSYKDANSSDWVWFDENDAI